MTPEKRQRFLAAVEYQMEHLHEVPAIVIACADMVVTPQGTFGEGVQAATEVWGAVQNLLLAARALGVGSVPTTLGLVDRDAAREVLNLPDHILPMVLIPLGWPTGNFGPIRRVRSKRSCTGTATTPASAEATPAVGAFRRD